MNQKRFRVEEFIVLLLMLNPYRNNLQLSNLHYYLLLSFLFALKLYKQKANPKTILLLLCFTSSFLQMLHPRFYIVTAFFGFLNIFYPWKLYYLPVHPPNVGYKKIQIHGDNQSDACVFYPCTTGDEVEIDWVTEGVLQKLHTNRRNTFKLPFFLFKFIFSYLKTYKFKVRNGEIGKHKGVIVFSHGAGGFLHVYSHFLRLLAEDYVIVTIQHIQKPLDITQKGKERQQRSEQLQLRSFSILQTLSYFKNIKQISKILGDEYNPSSYYLMGHSYGGATVLNTNYITSVEKQVDGIIILDPWFRAIREQRFKIPLKGNNIIMPFEKYWEDEEIKKYVKKVMENNKEENCKEYVIQNASHMDITDIPYVIGNLVPRGYNKKHEETTKIVMEIIQMFTSGKNFSRRQLRMQNKTLEHSYY